MNKTQPEYQHYQLKKISNIEDATPQYSEIKTCVGVRDLVANRSEGNLKNTHRHHKNRTVTRNLREISALGLAYNCLKEVHLMSSSKTNQAYRALTDMGNS